MAFIQMRIEGQFIIPAWSNGNLMGFCFDTRVDDAIVDRMKHGIAPGTKYYGRYWIFLYKKTQWERYDLSRVWES